MKYAASCDSRIIIAKSNDSDACQFPYHLIQPVEYFAVCLLTLALRFSNHAHAVGLVTVASPTATYDKYTKIPLGITVVYPSVGGAMLNSIGMI